MNSTYTYDGVVLRPEDLRYNPCDDVIFPSVIGVADHVAQPLGAYYLYYAPHDRPGGICLAYADDVRGPWTEYGGNPFITRDWTPHYEVSHVSSPHILWHEQEERFFLYFHGENETTRLATSSDGVHFEYQGEVLTTAMYEGISESSYARVFPCQIAGKDARYVLLFMGNNGGTRRIYAAWSKDGRSFEAQRQPLVSPPPDTGVTQVGAPWYLPQNGRNLIVFHGDSPDSEAGSGGTDLYLADVGTSFDEEHLLGLLFSRAAVSPSNERVSDPCFFEADGQKWLFMAIGPRLKQQIALAHAV